MKHPIYPERGYTCYKEVGHAKNSSNESKSHFRQGWIDKVFDLLSATQSFRRPEHLFRSHRLRPQQSSNHPAHIKHIQFFDDAVHHGFARERLSTRLQNLALSRLACVIHHHPNATNTSHPIHSAAPAFDTHFVLFWVLTMYKKANT
jgi:hypothetical protein